MAQGMQAGVEVSRLLQCPGGEWGWAGPGCCLWRWREVG